MAIGNQFHMKQCIIKHSKNFFNGVCKRAAILSRSQYVNNSNASLMIYGSKLGHRACWSLQWRHNEFDVVSYHRRVHFCSIDCLGRSKKTSKIRVTAGTINQMHVISTFDVSARKEIKCCSQLSSWIYCRESDFTLFVISQHWGVTGRWKSFPLMSRTHLFYTVNIKFFTWLVTEGVKCMASPAIVFI